MTGNTGLAGGHDKELAAGKRLGVALEHGGEVVELGGQGRPRQPEEQDAGVGELLVEDQLAEIPVCHHQNAPLPAGDGQDILVGEAVRVTLSGPCTEVKILRPGCHSVTRVEKFRRPAHL
jgi:hypothetical protein